MPNDNGITVTQDGRVLVGTQAERDEGMRQLTNGAGPSAGGDLFVGTGASTTLALHNSPTAADLVAMIGLGLTSWWGLGGPTWAGLVALGVTEIATPIARRQYPPSAFGARVDWWGLYGTTPLVVYRGARGLGASLPVAAGASLPVLATQALLRGSTWGGVAMATRPALMLSVMAHEWWKANRGAIRW